MEITKVRVKDCLQAHGLPETLRQIAEEVEARKSREFTTPNETIGLVLVRLEVYLNRPTLPGLHSLRQAFESYQKSLG